MKINTLHEYLLIKKNVTHLLLIGFVGYIKSETLFNSGNDALGRIND